MRKAYDKPRAHPVPAWWYPGAGGEMPSEDLMRPAMLQAVRKVSMARWRRKERPIVLTTEALQCTEPVAT